MNKSNFKLSLKLIEELDKIYPSPDALCSEVYADVKTQLGHVDDYSLAVFCIEFLSAMSNTKLEYMKPEMQRINHLYRFAHYLRMFELCQETNHPKLQTLISLMNASE